MPNVRTSGLWPLSFGQRIPLVQLAALREDSESWLVQVARRNRACVVVVPSEDAFLNRADFLPEAPSEASVAVRRLSAAQFDFGVPKASHEASRVHLFLQSEEDCFYWGAYQRVLSNDDSYIFLANRMSEEARRNETLEWEALGSFVDLPLDTPDSTLVAYFTDDRDAATVEHRRWQNHLAAWLRADGIEPLDYRSNRFHVDIAWELANTRRFVCEVKTVTSANERSQIFLGMGQAQSYGLYFDAQPVLLLGSKPSSFERVESPATLGVLVLWPEVLDVVKPHDLDGADSLRLLHQLL